MIDVYLFGSPRLEVNHARLDFDTRKALALLAYLLLNRGQHQRDSLALLLWPEYDQTSARGALRRTLSVLKNGLPATFLQITREQIGLSPDALVWCDALEFSNLVAEAKQHDHPNQSVCRECLGRLEKAAALYKGDFLSGFTLRDSPNFDEWQFFEAESQRQRLAWALHRLIDLQAGQGAFGEAIQYARRLVHLDPLREEAHRQLMLCYARDGQRSTALQQYRDCVRLFDKELGVPPLEDTTRLYQDILEGRMLPPVLAPSQERLPAAVQAGHPVPLVGRSHETAVMLQIYHSIEAEGRLLVLQGEPGIGKTRLADEFLAYTQSKGSLTFSARCYSGETNLAYAPFIEGCRLAVQFPIIAERLSSLSLHDRLLAALLVPDLLPGANQGRSLAEQESSASQSQFFESLRRVFLGLIEGDPPGILFLDDFHLADAASIQLLSYIIRRLKGHRVLVILTSRTEQMPPALLAAINEAQRTAKAEMLELDRLTQVDVIELLRAASFADDKQLAALADGLYAESEGLPFFIVEYFQAFYAGGEGIPTDQELAGAGKLMPVHVQDLLKSRLAGLDEQTWQIITTAAVIGRSFNFDILHAASGRSDLETIRSLENLVERQLVEEITPANRQAQVTFDFTHDKIRQYVYDQTSLIRRRILHRRVAEALERLFQRDFEVTGLVSQVAVHYQSAGELTLAAEYEKLAGDQARLVFAHQDAMHHYQSALALGYPHQIELYEGIGDLLTLSGEYQAALASFQSAASLAGPSNLGRFEYKVGQVYHRRGEYELACSHFQLAEAQGENQSDLASLAAIYADWSLSLHAVGQETQALLYANKSLDCAQETVNPQATAQAHNILGLLARANQDLSLAIEHCEHSLRIARRLDDLYRQAAALNNLALIQGEQGQLAESISSTHEALVICQKIGDRHREAALLNHLAEKYYEAGDADRAMGYLKQAVLIFADIGLDSGEPSPEIWRLTEW